jgi:hypothetical protein
MKYAVETGSVTVIYIPNLMKIGSGMQNLKRSDTQTHRQQGDLISLHFFRIRKTG